jgi:hypothetical protein
MPNLKNVGQAGDAGIGFLNGVLGGSIGLGGILQTFWCVLRGCALSLLGLGGMGLITPETTRLFLIGLPVLVAGTLLG